MSSESFRKLKAKWYKKLAKSGFKDIEDTNSENEYLNTWDSLIFLSKHNLQEFEAKKRYFELAKQFYHSHIFETSREKAIWLEYADGAKIREIARRRRTGFYKIRKVIKSLEGLMLGRS